MATSWPAAGVANVTLQQTGCAGLCDQEPMMTVTSTKPATLFRYGRLDQGQGQEPSCQATSRRRTPVDAYLIKTWRGE